MKNIRKLLSYIIPYKKLAALNVLFNLLQTFFSAFSVITVIPFLNILFETNKGVYETIPFQMDNIKEWGLTYMKYYISYLSKEYGTVKTLLIFSGFVILMSLFRNIFRYLSSHTMIPLRSGILRDLRNQMYRKINDLHLSFFSNKRKGDIISKMTVDVQEIEWSIMSSLEMIFRDPISILVNLVLLLMFSAELTLFLLILLPLSIFIMGRAGKSLKKRSFRGQRKMGGLLAVIEETLGGIRIIKAFNAEKFANERFEDMNASFTNTRVDIQRRRSLANPLSEFLGVTSMMAVLAYGGMMILRGDSSMTGELLIAYLLLFYFIITPAKSFSTAYYNIQKGMASVDRINEVLLAKNPIIDKPDAKPIQKFQYEIEYRNVSFRYDKAEVLKKVNIKIKKGQMVALVGHSGSGKSTIADLLPRFYEVESGDILIDGISIKNYKIKDLRSLMGIVNQESILFNDTFFNNISFGTERTKLEDVEQASKVANTYEFIKKYPQKFETTIGDRGCRLSGGQKQRVSIARAVLKNPPILILDEATSALDTLSEKLVQEALLKLMKNRTSLVIAHRLSTIKHADEICVVENGEIIERGKHSDLLKLNGAYKRLHDMQMQ